MNEMMSKLDLSNTELDESGLLYFLNDVDEQSDWHSETETEHATEITLGDGTIKTIYATNFANAGSMERMLVRRAYVGMTLAELNRDIGEMAGYWPYVNDGQVIQEWIAGDSIPAELTLDEELDAIRDPTRAEYSHGCRHDWQPADDMVFAGEDDAAGNACDVHCTKCSMGALTDERGNVIEDSIARAELNL